MQLARSPLTSRMITLFCERRLASALPTDVALALQGYLVGLLARREFPPYRGTQIDFEIVAAALSIESMQLRSAKAQLGPIFDAVSRSVAEAELRPQAAAQSKGDKGISPRGPKRSVGKPPKAVVEFPEPLEGTWDEPDDFGAALRLHAARHGETIYHLHKAVVRPEDGIHHSTLVSWARGAKAPRSVISLEVLRRIERRYRLPEGYFAEKASNPVRAATGFDLDDVPASERRRLAWHLPDDFNSRPRHEQAEILDWIRTVVISGSTDYRRYQAAAMRQHFAIRFACASAPRRKSSIAKAPDESGIIDAPPQLNAELAELLKFKTSTFAAFGLQRNGVWGEETASQKIEHFGLWFGAFAAPAASEVRGFGTDPKSLTFAMMAFPQVWDWYLQWREQRRGFYTKWEIDLLSIAAALSREETGWLRQTPRIGDHLKEIEGLITRRDIDDARADWASACDRMYRHARRRIKEINRVARIHRKPMLQIADSLINGSGLCQRLGDDCSDGTPYIAHLIREILTDQSIWPLVDFLKVDEEGDHAARCQSSCYRCIQRYGNRSYHGLLDWRLGLAYLRALVTPSYSVGLDIKDQNLPETRGWHDRALALAESIAGMRPDSLAAEVHGRSGLPSLRERQGGGSTFLVVHPLWRTDGDFGEYLSGGADVKFVDTFNLERRPLRAIELALIDQA